jgi:hypothetical protein
LALSALAVELVETSMAVATDNIAPKAKKRVAIEEVIMSDQFSSGALCCLGQNSRAT